MNAFYTSLFASSVLLGAGCNPPECSTSDSESTSLSSSTTEDAVPPLVCNDNGKCEKNEANCPDCRLCGNGDLDPGELCDDGDLDDSNDCVSNCQPATCGDQHVRANPKDPADLEACDDGERNVASGAYSFLAACIADPNNPSQGCKSFTPFCGDGSGCTTDDRDAGCGLDCPSTMKCGNGMIEPGEACDDGAETAACNGALAMGNGELVECQNTACGDGYPNLQAEACDDGNFENNDACVRHCVAAFCGDGLVQDGVEQCDSPDHCTVDDCKIIRHVFITSEAYTAEDIRGLNGGDAKCNAEAEAAKVPGRFRAWLSDSTGSPSSRFDTSFAGSYRLMNEEEIAEGWAGLTAGPLKEPINVDVSGGINITAAWTNTATDGSPASLMTHCSNWGLNAGTSSIGDASATNDDWTAAISGQSCASGFRLYCFEDR